MIIANDCDESRSHIMVHQLKRISSANYAVCNKLGQCLPKLYLNKNEYLLFDRVLCDVPCSSDGTLRKSPDLWRKWRVGFGNALHNVQLSILSRAINLCKNGGLIVYSTCTFNPIENEAVIAAALLRANHYYQRIENGKIKINVEIVDASQMYPLLKRNPGLQTWKVWHRKMNDNGLYSTYAQMMDDFNRKSMSENNMKPSINETMFPPQTHSKCMPIKHKILEYLKLENCMRFLPHFHDTGAFFVALLRKIKIDDEKKENSTEIKNENVNEENADLLNIEKTELDLNVSIDNYFPYFNIQQLTDYRTEVAEIINFYGLRISDDLKNDIFKNSENEIILNMDANVRQFELNELLIRGLKNPKTIWYVPKRLANIISDERNRNLRVIQAGCRAFVRHSSLATKHVCKWRLTQDGSVFLNSYLSKQIVFLPVMYFLMLAFKVQLKYEFIRDLSFNENEQKNESNVDGCIIADMIEQQVSGCLIVKLCKSDASELLNDRWNCLACWKSNQRIDLMIKKNELKLLQKHFERVFVDECLVLKEKFGVDIDQCIANTVEKCSTTLAQAQRKNRTKKRVRNKKKRRRKR